MVHIHVATCGPRCSIAQGFAPGPKFIDEQQAIGVLRHTGRDRQGVLILCRVFVKLNTSMQIGPLDVICKQCQMDFVRDSCFSCLRGIHNTQADHLMIWSLVRATSNACMTCLRQAS